MLYHMTSCCIVLHPPPANRTLPPTTDHGDMTRGKIMHIIALAGVITIIITIIIIIIILI